MLYERETGKNNINSPMVARAKEEGEGIDNVRLTEDISNDKKVGHTTLIIKAIQTYRFTGLNNGFHVKSKNFLT